MIVVAYVPPFSTLTETAVGDGIVCVGPGCVDPPAVVVGRAVVATIVGGIVVGTVVVTGCSGAELVQPAARMPRVMTKNAQKITLDRMQEHSPPEYKRIPGRKRAEPKRDMQCKAPVVQVWVIHLQGETGRKGTGITGRVEKVLTVQALIVKVLAVQVRVGPDDNAHHPL